MATPMLTVPGAVRAAILADCLARRPDEACGLLIGSSSVVTEATPVENVWPEPAERPTRFSIDPLTQAKAEAAALAAGRDVVGFYHSHPTSPAVPSEFDRARAWPTYVYLIVGLSDVNNVEFRFWTLDDAGEFVEHVGV